MRLCFISSYCVRAQEKDNFFVSCFFLLFFQNTFFIIGFLLLFQNSFSIIALLRFELPLLLLLLLLLPMLLLVLPPLLPLLLLGLDEKFSYSLPRSTRLLVARLELGSFESLQAKPAICLGPYIS